MQLFLLEECEVYVSISTISRHLHAEGWKKKRAQTKAAQRSDPLRLDHLRKTSMFTAEMFVFCDESGIDRRDGVRRTAWAPVGIAPVVDNVFKRGKRFHILPAITVDGALDLLVYQGHTNKEGFIQWLKDGVLPKMRPFPDCHSILVMDNASWHHDAEVKRLCFEAGVLLWYLPPYSPDFNPIEATFGDTKAYVRRHYSNQLSQDHTDEEFHAFLYSAYSAVANNVEAVGGHFRQAMLTFRHNEEAVDYMALYSKEFLEFQQTGTVA